MKGHFLPPPIDEGNLTANLIEVFKTLTQNQAAGEQKGQDTLLHFKSNFIKYLMTLSQQVMTRQINHALIVNQLTFLAHIQSPIEKKILLELKIDILQNGVRLRKELPEEADRSEFIDDINKIFDNVFTLLTILRSNNIGFLPKKTLADFNELGKSSNPAFTISYDHSADPSIKKLEKYCVDLSNLANFFAAKEMTHDTHKAIAIFIGVLQKLSEISDSSQLAKELSAVNKYNLSTVIYNYIYLIPEALDECMICVLLLYNSLASIKEGLPTTIQEQYAILENNVQRELAHRKLAYLQANNCSLAKTVKDLGQILQIFAKMQTLTPEDKRLYNNSQRLLAETLINIFCIYGKCEE